ncbi:MAG: hypothetical protein LBV00_10130 [Propionibacteriaceae bacterium]|jgi:alpha-D-xyloside xylohydrolase|nr:hypothetical protein [Propionibacteriaceae bacterium]
MSYFSVLDDQLVCRSEGEVVVIAAWGPDSFRVRARLMGEVEDDRWSLLEPAPTKPAITLTDDSAVIRNGRIAASVSIDPWSKLVWITFTDDCGAVLLKEGPNGSALHSQARLHKPMAGGDQSVTAVFEAQPDEHFHGLGQYQDGVFDLKGSVFELAHRNSQACVPFVISSRGYGFLWHNQAIGEVSFNHNRTQWRAWATKQLDYWITAGESPTAISENYARATGFPPVMPEYGLGFWQCRLRYWNQEQLLDVAREYHRRGIPLDVIVCDFFHWPHMGDFRFDPEFFPDPAAMTRELKAMGTELMVSVWPQVALTSENYEEMRQEGLLVRADRGEQIGMRFQEDSMFFDATNPRAREYVWKKCQANYHDLGVRLFWLDEAEPEFGSYDFANFRYAAGPVLQAGNVYPAQFSRGFYEGMTAAGQSEIVNLVRCAWSGSQRYGALVWSGDIHSDWETLRRQVVAGLNMGVAGIPWWTTDIGGFGGGDPDDPDFRELLIRWFQWGTFCPVMRLHGDRVPQQRVSRADGTRLMESGAGNEIWSFGPQAEEILTAHIDLRERLRGYTRSLMSTAHQSGTPVMRAMFYEFPSDPTCQDLHDQYMFGPDILVAPVLNPGVAVRSVYLPLGSTWTDAHAGRSYDGGQWITCPTPLETIPYFTRGDAAPLPVAD